MKYDFETRLDRSGTGSLKWDRYAGITDKRGRGVLPLWVADMDFVSAPEILADLQNRVADGVFGYTVPWLEAENAVLDYLNRVHQYDAESKWLHWVHGCVPALNVFSRAFGNPGDEILTCTPVYPPFLSAPVWQGKTLVSSHLTLENSRWTFDFDDLESKVTPRTKAFILCNPHNPVGTVYTRDELERLGEFCLRHNLVLCSDEIHCDLLFDDSQHVMTATLSPEIADICVTLHAPSKTYNLPGLSCSFAVISNPTLRAQFAQAARGFVTEVNAMGYAGCISAYQNGEHWRRALITKLQENRDFLYDFVKQHLAPYLYFEQYMSATYLAWINVEGLRQSLRDDVSLQRYLIDNAGVALSPGVDFGDSNYLRLNFGCPRATLNEALERIAEALNEIEPR